MNVFYLHTNPRTAARAMTSKHVVKMILESAQLLSTAHLVLDGQMTVGLSKSGRRQKQFIHADSNILYKATHINHPSAIWCRESIENYEWLWQHFSELCTEYTRRYDRIHATEIKLLNRLRDLPVHLTRHVSKIPVPRAMPSQYQHSDATVAYRQYYEAEKLKLETDVIRYKKILEIG